MNFLNKKSKFYFKIYTFTLLSHTIDKGKYINLCVFCLDCNAEYKVDERSSLTKTIKFVCIECESSWIDKFEKLEQAKREVYASQEFNSDVVIENKNKEVAQWS